MHDDLGQHRHDSQAVRIRYLSPADAAVLDAAVDAGDAAAETLRARKDDPRSQRLAELLALLDVLPDEPSDEAHEQGVQGALAAVQAARQRDRFATQVQMLTGPEPTIGIGWRQILTAAAAFLIAASLLLPALERNRSEARRVACATNMQNVFSDGFQPYAAGHQGLMPRGRVEPGGVWWNVGQRPASEDAAAPSNTAHLFILIRERYVAPEQLACPENSSAFVRDLSANVHDWPRPEAVSYSYQNQYRAEPMRLAANGHLALLADKNPLFVAENGQMTFDREASRTSASRQHGGRGQNVLTADGSVTWTVRPLLVRGTMQGEKNNFWVAEGHATFTGREIPTAPDDNFLVP